MRTLVHLIRCVVGLDSPDSQVSARELQMLLKYSRNASVICEIGCYEGKTSVALAKNTTGTVYSVDPFFKGRLGIPYGHWIARLHSKRSHTRNLVLIQGFSKEVAATFNLPIDFLFIDGDHSYDAAKSDWTIWYPKIVEGGMIALHDASSPWCKSGCWW
jgi:predicted O-methyltransferase YrrM